MTNDEGSPKRESKKTRNPLTSVILSSEESLINSERGNSQRCLKAWPHASHFVAALRST